VRKDDDDADDDDADDDDGDGDDEFESGKKRTVIAMVMLVMLTRRGETPFLIYLRG
jgi:hypothetical protein